MKALHQFITKIEPPKWVLLILALVVLARIPSFFEPYYYGDEMIYLTLGNAMRHGLTLYKVVHDNKPPLIYLTAALAGNLFWFKAILSFWMLATISAFWHLIKNLFPNSKLAQKVSVIFFAILTTIPLFEGNIVNAELFLIGPIILAFVLLLTNPSIRNLFLAGLLFGLAALFKIPAVFDLPVIVIFWLINLDSFKINKLIDIAKKTLTLALGFLLPLTLTFVWYFLKGALPDYFNAAFLQNFGYISSWNGTSQSFVVKHGPLLIRAGVVIVGLILLRLKSKTFSKPFLLACIWLLTSLFATTLSERPYPHYMIQALPSIAILVALLVSSAKKEQVFTVIPLALALFVPVYYQFYYYPTFSYYANFVQLATNHISKGEYFSKFNPETQNNYQIAQVIMTSTIDSEKVFVWGGDAPVIYALSRRLPPIKYVADYHITDFSSLAETGKALTQTLPSLIVILPKAQNFPQLNSLLATKYVLISTQSNAQIWHLLMH